MLDQSNTNFVAKLMYKGKILKNYPYVLKLADGSFKSGNTDDNGFIIENDIVIGEVTIL